MQPALIFILCFIVQDTTKISPAFKSRGYYNDVNTN